VNTKTQIWIDRKLVKPFVSTTNLLVRLVGQILRLDHNLQKDFKTIAVCKYKGLGSIIQATPLLQTLRKQYPEARIVFISTRANKALLQKIDCIDECIFLDDSGFTKLLLSYPRFILKLIALRIGVFIDLEIYSNFSSLTTTLSLARNRLGFYLRASHYRMGIYTHMMYYNTDAPIMQTYLQMARLLGAENEVETLYPLKATENAAHLSLPSKYMVINVNASDLRIERRWPLNNFEALIEHILEKWTEFGIVLIGSPSEAEYVNQLYERFSDENLINLAGKTSFDELITVIEQAKLMITNDTGPLHIAASLNKPSVALFGPCTPQQYGALNKVNPVYLNLYCSPCVHEFDTPPCKGDNQCMKQIAVHLVTKAIENTLREEFKTNTTNRPFRSENGNALGEVMR